MLEKLSEPPDPYILVLMGSGVLIALVAWLPLVLRRLCGSDHRGYAQCADAQAKIAAGNHRPWLVAKRSNRPGQG